MATITTINGTDTITSSRSVINTNFSNLNTDKLEFSQNGDFYKYVISRTVDGSGNMTVTLLNYLGATPSVSAPVKVQIGDTVRTITSALSKTLNAGSFSYFNAASAELSGKEIDFFTYLGYRTAASSIELGWARKPNANVGGDLSIAGVGGENEIYWTNAPAYTDPVVNIGRFNAILTTPGIWSIPATSVIVNRPIFTSRKFSYTTVPFGSSGSGTLNIIRSEYLIEGNKINVIIRAIISSKGTLSGDFHLSLPFSVDNNSYPITGGIYANGTNTSRGFCDTSGNSLVFTKASQSALLTWADTAVNDEIDISGFYYM